MPPTLSNLGYSIRAATERPAVARTRALLSERGYTATEWDAMVAYHLESGEWSRNFEKWLAEHRPCSEESHLIR